MGDVVIADQEYAQAMMALCKQLAELRRICYEHANILGQVANYAGFQSAEFSLSIATYAPQVKAVGDNALDLAERVLEETTSFVQDIDGIDRFMY